MEPKRLSLAELKREAESMMPFTMTAAQFEIACDRIQEMGRELGRARWWASGWAQSTNIETDLAGRNISIQRMAKSEWRMKKALWRLIAATKA